MYRITSNTLVWKHFGVLSPIYIQSKRSKQSVALGNDNNTQIATIANICFLFRYTESL